MVTSMLLVLDLDSDLHSHTDQRGSIAGSSWLLHAYGELGLERGGAGLPNLMDAVLTLYMMQERQPAMSTWGPCMARMCRGAELQTKFSASYKQSEEVALGQGG